MVKQFSFSLSGFNVPSFSIADANFSRRTGEGRHDETSSDISSNLPIQFVKNRIKMGLNLLQKPRTSEISLFQVMFCPSLQDSLPKLNLLETKQLTNFTWGKINGRN